MKIRKHNLTPILPRQCKRHGVTYLAGDILFDAHNCGSEISFWFMKSFILFLFALKLKREALEADFALSPIVKSRTQSRRLLLTKEGARYNRANTVPWKWRHHKWLRPFRWHYQRQSQCYAVKVHWVWNLCILWPKANGKEPRRASARNSCFPTQRLSAMINAS